MDDRKYQIHGAPGVAWLLVFVASSRQWFVEELRIDPRRRERIPLEESQRSAIGKVMADRLQGALATAAADISTSR